MKQLLVQLVGAQAQPNIICVKAVQPDVVINFYTSKTETVCDNIKHFMKSCFPEITGKYIELQSSSPSIQETYDTIEAQLKKYSKSEYRVIINYTGGTKPMSIGAFLVGRDNKNTLLYADGNAYDENTLKEGESFKNSPWKARPLTIGEILHVEGKEIIKNSNFDNLKEIANERFKLRKHERAYNRGNENKLNFSLYPAHREFEWHLKTPKNNEEFQITLERKVYPYFKKLLEDATTAKLPVQNICELCCREGWLELSETGEYMISKSLNDKKKLAEVNNFLDGGWWEVIVAVAMEEIMGKGQVLWSLETNTNAETEDDIVASYKNRLFVVSCKAGYDQNKMLVELNNLKTRARRLGGGNSIPVLARCGHLKSYFHDYANELGILVLKDKDIVAPRESLERKIQDWLESVHAS